MNKSGFIVVFRSPPPPTRVFICARFWFFLLPDVVFHVFCCVVWEEGWGVGVGGYM